MTAAATTHDDPIDQAAFCRPRPCVRHSELGSSDKKSPGDVHRERAWWHDIRVVVLQAYDRDIEAQISQCVHGSLDIHRYIERRERPRSAWQRVRIGN